MNYVKIYESIIERSKLRGLDKRKLEGYHERHHIIPACYFKSRKIASYTENMVLLTGREHFVVHMLLWKIDKLNRALFMAHYRNSRCFKDAKFSSRQYEILKEYRSKLLSGKGNPMYEMNGELNPFFGKTHSDETKKKLKKAWEKRKLRPLSSETKLKLSLINKGRKFSDAHKKKIGQANKKPKSRESVLKRNDAPPNGKKIIIDGIIYPSKMNAVRHLGLSKWEFDKTVKYEYV